MVPSAGTYDNRKYPKSRSELTEFVYLGLLIQ